MSRHVHVHFTRDSWEESKHPRDGGKFSSKPGAGKEPDASGPAPADKEPGGAVMEKVLRENLPKHHPITDEELAKAAAYMEGKKAIDTIRMSDATGLSVGRCKMLNDARKAHFRAQGPSKTQTQAERVGRYLSQRPAPQR
jgi:hypothetical protein